MKFSRNTLLSAVLLFLLCLQIPARADSPFQFITELTPSQIPPGGAFTVSVVVAIAQDHYLFAGDMLLLTPAQTPGIIFESVQKPDPIQKQDPYLGEIFIYAETLRLTLPATTEISILPGVHPIAVKLKYQGCSQGICFLPEEITLTAAVTIGGETDYPVASAPDDLNKLGLSPDAMIFDADSAPPTLADSAPAPETVKDSEPERTDIPIPAEKENPFTGVFKRFGVFGVLGAAFIWGLLASLTPCVYPMIPITIGVIGANSAGSMKRGFTLSVVYVLGLSLTYALFGLIAAVSGTLFGEHTNHPAVRILVAGVFIALGLSLFDLFMLQLPASLQTRLGRYSGSGLLGVFITGAVAGCIIGPCVGPMLMGLLLYIAALGSKLQGFLIMWSFALGMGMLFLIIGTFSGLAVALPKAGNWMEIVKRFFGLVFFGIALYYLEPILGQPLFLLLTGAYFIALGLFFYPLGKDAGIIPDIRLAWKTISLVLVVIGVCDVGRFALSGREMSSLPLSQPPVSAIEWFSDEAAAFEAAKQSRKPLMIDFRADWCADCKKLERETFTHPSVIEASRRFVCLKLDFTDSNSPAVKDWQARYKVKGLPLILFFDNQGRLLPEKTITGFLNPHDFLAQLKKIP